MDILCGQIYNELEFDVIVAGGYDSRVSVLTADYSLPVPVNNLKTHQTRVDVATRKQIFVVSSKLSILSCTNS